MNRRVNVFIMVVKYAIYQYNANINIYSIHRFVINDDLQIIT